MKMAKTIRSLVLLTSLLAVTACDGGTTSNNSSTTEQTTVEKAIADAETLDRKELYKKAMEELGDNTMNCVGNSSRGATGLEYFLAYLRGQKATQTKDADGNKTWTYEDSAEIQAEFPYYDPNFKGQITWQQPKNNTIFDMIDGDIKAGTQTFSMTLIQDGNQIQSKELDTGNLLNYVPKEWKGSDDNKEPLALQSLNKVFEFNNLDTSKTFTNMWDFVREGESPLFMGINSEPIGRNFLVEITAPEYASQVKAAYDAITDTDEKAYVDAAIKKVEDDAVATTYGIEGDNAKYALAWDYLWMKQYQQETDDGPICNTLVSSSAAGQSGLLVYSKLRSVTETTDVSKNNITIAAYQDGYTGLGGFMYKHYMQILKTCPYPYTACAFINFLTTTHDGFAAWGKDIGGYAADENVRAMFDHSADGAATDTTPAYPALNDKGYDWWKEKVVVEDPVYVAEHNVLVTWFDTLRS